MYCEFCEKVCKNLNSKRQHEIRCTFNPKRIIVKSNFISYNEKLKAGEAIKEFSNQFTKAEALGIDKPIVTVETREKISSKQRGRIWSDEQKKRHSSIMTRVAAENPDSYSASNVCGRTKLMDITDSLGRATKVNGSWEQIVATFLDENNIRWTNVIEEKLLYTWDGQERRYYPDFYLIDFNMYIEVKGYERPRDLEKWKIVEDCLIVIKQKDINAIKKKEYKLVL